MTQSPLFPNSRSITPQTSDQLPAAPQIKAFQSIIAPQAHNYVTRPTSATVHTQPDTDLHR